VADNRVEAIAAGCRLADVLPIVANLGHPTGGPISDLLGMAATEGEHDPWIWSCEEQEDTWSVRETVNTEESQARPVNGREANSGGAKRGLSRVDELVSSAVAADPTALAISSAGDELT
jgi:hypothetical protein